MRKRNGYFGLFGKVGNQQAQYFYQDLGGSRALDLCSAVVWGIDPSHIKQFLIPLLRMSDKDAICPVASFLKRFKHSYPSFLIVGQNWSYPNIWLMGKFVSFISLASTLVLLEASFPRWKSLCCSGLVRLWICFVKYSS